MSDPKLEAIKTALQVHDAARDLEREQGFPGMFSNHAAGFLGALEVQDPPFTVVPLTRPADIETLDSSRRRLEDG